MSGIAGNCKNGNKAGQVDRTKPETVWSCLNSLQLRDFVPRQDQQDQLSPKVLYSMLYMALFGIFGPVGPVM